MANQMEGSIDPLTSDEIAQNTGFLVLGGAGIGTPQTPATP